MVKILEKIELPLFFVSFLISLMVIFGSLNPIWILPFFGIACAVRGINGNSIFRRQGPRTLK